MFKKKTHSETPKILTASLLHITCVSHHTHDSMETGHETFDHIPLFTTGSCTLWCANVWWGLGANRLCRSGWGCLCHTLPECFQRDGDTVVAAFVTLYLRSNLSWSSRTAANSHCSNCADSAHAVQAHVHCCLLWGGCACVAGAFAVCCLMALLSSLLISSSSTASILRGKKRKDEGSTTSLTHTVFSDLMIQGPSSYSLIMIHLK